MIGRRMDVPPSQIGGWLVGAAFSGRSGHCRSGALDTHSLDSSLDAGTKNYT